MFIANRLAMNGLKFFRTPSSNHRLKENKAAEVKVNSDHISSYGAYSFQMLAISMAIFF